MSSYDNFLICNRCSSPVHFPLNSTSHQFFQRQLSGRYLVLHTLRFRLNPQDRSLSWSNDQTKTNRLRLLRGFTLLDIFHQSLFPVYQVLFVQIGLLCLLLMLQVHSIHRQPQCQSTSSTMLLFKSSCTLTFRLARLSLVNVAVSEDISPPPALTSL